MPRTKTLSNSCYKVASFAQEGLSSLEGNRKASPGAKMLNSGSDTELWGCLTKPPRILHPSPSAALASGSLVPPVGQRGRCSPGTARSEPPGDTTGKKGAKGTECLYCSAGLCSVSSVSTLGIFRQGKDLVISLSSQWLNPHKIAVK